MDTRPPATTGTPESAAWFRGQLETLGMSQTAFAKWLARRGDDRKPATILRTVQRMANGEARVSGEMRVILSMMVEGAKKGAERIARKRGEGSGQGPLGASP